ncbi:TetR family transcriptional regulator [Kangiella sp. HZ709]|uniref:TetR family transcriptional regulator n=1 Tax=Kangiella sp. HZ709 TaxID=2666328 RepID=UPI0018A23A29|nr:TetR family transcriptional regulator [Kangiella sp. HZ709]
MPKKTKDEAAQTRLSLLEAAKDEFYQNGIANTSIKQIVEKAGVTRGAFYWHFKNKEEVLNALLDQTIATYQEYFEGLIHKEMNSLDILETHAVNLFTTIYQDEKQKKSFAIFMQTIGTEKNMPIFHAHSEQVYYNSLKFYEEQFEQARQDKLISKANNPKVLAFAYNAYLTGVLDSWYASPKDINLDISTYAKSLIELLLNPLKI